MEYPALPLTEKQFLPEDASEPQILWSLRQREHVR